MLRRIKLLIAARWSVRCLTERFARLRAEEDRVALRLLRAVHEADRLTEEIRQSGGLPPPDDQYREARARLIRLLEGK